MTPGLLLIDIQNDYFPGGKMELHGSVEAARVARRLLECFRLNHLPVVHIQHLSTRDGATFFIPGTLGANLHDEVQPQVGEKVIQKHYPNSFRETDLLAHLQNMGVRPLVIAGMMTHMCVDATTRAAADYGFECQIVQDACATRNLALHGQEVLARDAHLAFLAALNEAYGRVVMADAVIAELMKSS